MLKYKLTIAYDGTHYCGWQVQPTGSSIQSQLQAALQIVLKEPIALTGSGRTDAGVHARGQVAHFCYQNQLDDFRFLYRLNALLPNDIRVLDLNVVSMEFHARYSACRKIYRYALSTGTNSDLFQRLYRYHVRRNLNVESLRAGAQLLIGMHDFKAFAHAAHQGVAAYDSVRTLYRIDVLCSEGNKIDIEFEGDGFLYRMVRNLVGTLLEIAYSKRAASTLFELLQVGQRKQAGPTAPAHGLYLMKVCYPA